MKCDERFHSRFEMVIARVKILLAVIKFGRFDYH